MSRQLIVFDLDETLVHATESPLSRPADFVVPPYFIYRRPFLDDLLTGLMSDFDLAVWSSSSRAYVDAVVAEIFRKPHLLKFAWAVERCVQKVDVKTNSYVYIKDLRKIQGQGYTLERIIMVDDSPEKIVRQPRNHLPITPFTGQDDDRALIALLALLTSGRQPSSTGQS